MHLKRNTQFFLKSYKCVKLTEKPLYNDVEMSNRQITLNSGTQETHDQFVLVTFGLTRIF